MMSLHETAYPRLKLEPSTQELRDVYTPTAAELRIVKRHRRQSAARLALSHAPTPILSCNDYGAQPQSYGKNTASTTTPARIDEF